MKIIKTSELPVERQVEFHSGVSNRIVLAEDNMGFTMTKTVIEPGKQVFQHFKRKLIPIVIEQRNNFVPLMT